ncbi:HNH endonuclease [Gordonia phage Terapin]|uniref:HNH endonuclease n=5 Tax=Terapinvirus terapin TaxID=2734283 RepID=A0A345MB91_9CAUD|nr:HNH endonuclease [Gordonia phage Terapin]AVP43328.1 HNH endonuclease [Gordonia phage Djokovic]AXH67762.1 HNH endonuclease [Gordonia phage Beyoncage]QOC56196.1 HNH endonuclease [Gordonia phage Sienna]QOC56621.1 HNH endonuclease [Gordonia phage BiteSize]QYW00854.1 HNH endonuclease [Gordonia phage Madi]
MTTSKNRRNKRKRFFEECEERDAPCWICKEPIQYRDDQGEVSTEGPWRFSIDHYKTIFSRPDLEWDYLNWRPSHYLCNNRRGNRSFKNTVWVGSKELGRWSKEHDEMYERRIAKEEQQYRILTGVIQGEIADD